MVAKRFPQGTSTAFAPGLAVTRYRWTGLPPSLVGGSHTTVTPPLTALAVKLATFSLMVAIPMVSWGSLGLPLAAAATVAGWAAYAVGIVEYYVAAFAYLGEVRRSSYRGAGSEDGAPAR